MPSIKLQSSDGEVFPVDVEIAKQSVTIKTMLEDLGMDEEDEEVVPLPNVNAAILKKVIQWATYHKDDPPLPEDDENKEKRTDDICSWDADFLKVDQGTLFELILAANYLDIKVTSNIQCQIMSFSTCTTTIIVLMFCKNVSTCLNQYSRLLTQCCRDC